MSAGHTAYAKTFDRIRRRYYFEDMPRLTKEFCEKCPSCRKYKGSTPPPHPPHRYPLPTQPWSVVHIDIAEPLLTPFRGDLHRLLRDLDKGLMNPQPTLESFDQCATEPKQYLETKIK